MKRISFLPFSFPACVLVLGAVGILSLAKTEAVYAQNIEGQPIASQYGAWRVQGYTPDTYTNFAPTSCRVQGGQSYFFAFTVGVPIRIVDGNPALSETVTPSAVINTNDNCSITISPVNRHQIPFYLTSATGGLQESLLQNATTPGANTIVLDNGFYQLVGSDNVPSVIASVSGYKTLGLVDITQTPYVWYQWNGSQYVAAPLGASGAPPQYAIQYYETSSSLGADSNILISPVAHTVTAVGGFIVPGSGTGSIQMAGASSGGAVTMTVDPSTHSWTDTLPTSAPSSNGACRTATTAGVESWTPCIPSPNPGWYNSLGAAQEASDTTATLALTPTDYAAQGCFYVDLEWECYSGISGNELTGLTRGFSQTTAAAHEAGAIASSVNVDLGSTDQEPQAVYGGGGGSRPAVLGLNNGTPGEGGSAVLSINSGNNSFSVNIGGDFHGENVSAISTLSGSLSVGTALTVGGGGATPGSAQVPLTATDDLLQTSGQNTADNPIGFAAGIAGPTSILPPQTIAAPTLQVACGGSSSYTYVVTGLDSDGNTIPGTPATASNACATLNGLKPIFVIAPLTAGVETYQLWRTSGNPNTGLVGSGGPYFVDGGQTASGGTPPSSNTSVPKICIGAGETSCWISGSAAPSGTCTDGWLYTNQSSSPATLYQCVSTAWQSVALPLFSATTGSLGGSALAAGACSTTTVSISGLTMSMDVHATPTTYPGDGNYWAAYASAAGTASVKVCATIAGTPSASTYNVRVTQ